MVSQEVELRAIIVDYYRSQMIDRKHYYTLQTGQKPALSKEGALNLCSLFKVRVAAEAPCEQHHDDGHYSVRYRVHLVSMRSGDTVADGDGSCSTRESKYAYRWVKAADVPETINTAMLVKRSGRYGVQYRVPNSDIADHYNTALKMAYKRAIVAAALCLPLVSELFTQDLDEQWSPAQRPQREGAPAGPPPEAPPSVASRVSQQVEPQQLKELWSRINQYGVDHEAFRNYLMQRGLQSTKELSLAQLKQCLREIDSLQGQAFQPADATDAEIATQSQGIRAQLFETFTILKAEITQAEQAQEPSEPPFERPTMW